MGLLLYCRAGFEVECAQEICAIAEAVTIPGQVSTDRGAGFVTFHAAKGTEESALRDTFQWRNLVFARQCLIAFACLEDLSRADRLTPIMAALSARGETFCDVWTESPDSDAGKQLAPLCKSFGNALVGALKKARLLDASAPRRLHVFFPQGDKVYLCAADPAGCAPWLQGIPRLKFPHAAPSRSTLKLEEALLTLLDEPERARWLKPGMMAVDLGAAPGGWTYQLVRRSLRVTAIDNGPMDHALLDSGLVTHRREDGFRYRPPKPVDWLVCDMVEQPRRIADLVALWLEQGWCRYAIFNLKLPMKKRYEETRSCLARVRAAAADVRAKQLYHDREEITVFARAPR
ncbi:MAG: 23S rRNA (cytidine(2498)-2'-O)-methyltransferase RlmM [Rudaea sp.]